MHTLYVFLASLALLAFPWYEGAKAQTLGKPLPVPRAPGAIQFLSRSAEPRSMAVASESRNGPPGDTRPDEGELAHAVLAAPMLTPTPTPTSVPYADFEATPLEGPAPLTVEFHNTSPGQLVSCSWGYGDDEHGNTCDAHHSHTYETPGSYTVSLTIVKPSGSSNKETKPNYIQVLAATPSPTATATPTPTTTAPATETATVTATSTADSSTPTRMIYLPLIVRNEPTASEPEMEWDPRLDPLHVTYHPAADCSQGCWRLRSARYEDPTESNGTHNIYARLLDGTGKQMGGAPWHSAWPDGDVRILSKPAPEWADFPMYAWYYWEQGPGPYRSYAGDAESRSDSVRGMGLPVRQHVNFRLTWQWVEPPPTPTATPTNTATPTATPTATATVTDSNKYIYRLVCHVTSGRSFGYFSYKRSTTTRRRRMTASWISANEV